MSLALAGDGGVTTGNGLVIFGSLEFRTKNIQWDGKTMFSKATGKPLFTLAEDNSTVTIKDRRSVPARLGRISGHAFLSTPQAPKPPIWRICPNKCYLIAPISNASDEAILVLGTLMLSQQISSQ